MPRKPSAANAPKRSTSNVRRTIGANIKARRLTLGWSQQELADRFGVSRATVSQYEIGTGEVNAGDLPRLAEILGVGLLDFFGPPRPVSPTLPPVKEYDEHEYVEIAYMKEADHSTSFFLRDHSKRHAHHIGTVANPAESEAMIALVGSLLELSPEHQETVRRVVEAIGTVS